MEQASASSSTTTTTTTTTTTKTETTSDPWFSPYANLMKDELNKIILMGEKKTRSQLVFLVLNTLHFIVNDGGYLLLSK